MAPSSLLSSVPRYSMISTLPTPSHARVLPPSVFWQPLFSLFLSSSLISILDHAGTECKANHIPSHNLSDLSDKMQTQNRAKDSDSRLWWCLELRFLSFLGLLLLLETATKFWSIIPKSLAHAVFALPSRLPCIPLYSRSFLTKVMDMHKSNAKKPTNNVGNTLQLSRTQTMDPL